MTVSAIMTTKLLKSSDQIRFYLSHVTSASDNVIEFFINASISYCLVEFLLEINIIIDLIIKNASSVSLSIYNILQTLFKKKIFISRCTNSTWRCAR